MLSNSQHWTAVKAYTKHTKHQKNSSVSTSLRRPDVGKRHSSWEALCRQSFHQWETKIWGENTAETQQQIWFDMVCMASILQTWWVFELYRVLKTMFEPFEGFKVQGIPRTCIMSWKMPCKSSMQVGFQDLEVANGPTERTGGRSFRTTSTRATSDLCTNFLQRCFGCQRKTRKIGKKSAKMIQNVSFHGSQVLLSRTDSRQNRCGNS